MHGNGKPHEQIAAGVMSPHEAEVLVEMWTKGYRSRAREGGRVLGNPHYHMLAEAGAIGAKMNGGA